MVGPLMGGPRSHGDFIRNAMSDAFKMIFKKQQLDIMLFCNISCFCSSLFWLLSLSTL